MIRFSRHTCATLWSQFTTVFNSNTSFGNITRCRFPHSLTRIGHIKDRNYSFQFFLVVEFCFYMERSNFFPFRYNSTWSSPTTARIFTTIPTWEKLKLVHVGFFPVAAGSHIQWEGKSTPKMKSRKGDGSKRQTADCEVTAQVKGAEIHKLEKLESVCLV